MKFFEDIAVGQRREFGSFTFTAENIKAFARQFYPQTFHLDEEAGRNSLLGGGRRRGSPPAARRRCGGRRPAFAS